MRKKFEVDTVRHLIVEYDNYDILGFFIILMFSCSNSLINIYNAFLSNSLMIHFLAELCVEITFSIIVYILIYYIRYRFFKRTIGKFPYLNDQIINLIEYSKNIIKKSNDEENLTEQLNDLSISINQSIEHNNSPLKFDPDNEAINKLFCVNNLIVITEAELYKWLDPTYIFYLINNCILNLNWTQNGKNVFLPIKFSSNKQNNNDLVGSDVFEAFNIKRKRLLDDLSVINPNDPLSLDELFLNLRGTVRFIFVSDEDMVKNKSTIEYLYTTHELFGCYLYLINIDMYKANYKLIDRNIIEHLELFRVITSTNYDCKANEHKIDIGFGLNCNNQLDVFQRTKSNLVSTNLPLSVKVHLANYLKEIAKYLTDGTNFNNERILYNNLFSANSTKLTPNNQNYFIYF